MCTTFGDARVAGTDEHVGGTDDVDRVEQRAVLRERHLRDVVEHHIGTVACSRAPRLAIADVTCEELEVDIRLTPVRSRRRRDAVTASECLSGETLPK